MDKIQMVIAQDGSIKGIYSDNLAEFLRGTGGEMSVTRASHVEPDGKGGWTADMAPSGGPALGPFPRRDLALEAEIDWLKEKLLCQRPLRS